MKHRVAILISGRGSNMTALIEAARAEAFPAEIAVVVSNKADAAGLAKARDAGVAAVAIESAAFGTDRAGFEATLQAVLDEYRVDLICLGGFMRLFTAEFVQRWHGRMLNIHPSLLPSFPGLDPHGQALRAGVKISGATVHFVIAETDAGPIVMQGAVAVRHDDSAATLAARVLEVEHRIYPEALRLVAAGAVVIDSGVCRIAGRAPRDHRLISPATG
jgi:phosphoribosylglycinamide formyltransferase-1